MLIAVDFDGTVVKDGSPGVGHPMPRAAEVLRELVAAGHRIILWTCRENCVSRNYLSEAVEWFVEREILLFGINATPAQADPRKWGTVRLRKVYADLYIDDRNLGGFPGWAAVREMVLGKEKA